jgi:hypothetical protein
LWYQRIWLSSDGLGSYPHAEWLKQRAKDWVKSYLQTLAAEEIAFKKLVGCPVSVPYCLPKHQESHEGWHLSLADCCDSTTFHDC